MPLSASSLEMLRSYSKDEAAYTQLVDLFEREASASENLYRVLADNFPDGIVALLDRDLRFIVMSGSAGTIDLASVRGRRMADVFGSDIASRDEPHIRAALQGEARTTEVEYLGGYYRVHTLPVRDQNHDIFAAMVVSQDITSRRVAEAAEHEARLLAEEANQLKLHFLAMISHELRTPLASIKGFSSTLLSEETQFDPGTQNEFIKIIDEEADRLNNLVGQLLDLSRLEAGTLSIAAEAISLPRLIENITGKLRMLTRNHTVIFNVPESLPPVWADPERLTQVFANLVENSAKYAPWSTVITITAAQRSNLVQIDVADTGRGIEPKNRVAVFDPFLQIPDSHGQMTKGAGLGLAICRGIVEALGGTIWIQDTPPPGTTVSFTLPVVENSV